MDRGRKFDVYVYIYRTVAIRRWLSLALKVQMDMETSFLESINDLKLLRKFCILLRAVNSKDATNEDGYKADFETVEEALAEMIFQMSSLLGGGETKAFEVIDVVSKAGGFKVVESMERVILEVTKQWNAFGDVQLPDLESMAKIIKRVQVADITQDVVDAAIDEMGDISALIEMKAATSLKPKLYGIANYLKGDATALAEASDIFRTILLNMSLLPVQLYIVLISLLIAAITKNYVFK